MIARRLPLGVAVVLGGFGLWQVSAGIAIHAKAMLAQILLDRAWQRTRAGDVAVKPWPWADTWPVARLRAAGQRDWTYVLADASGRSLAFGPGHVAGTAAPGTRGNSVIAAHRDTHFRFLELLAAGDAVELETADGHKHVYHVVDRRVIDSRRAPAATATDAPTLTLVTCYPFDAVVPGGPLRYVVTAVVETAPAKLLAAAP